MRLWLLPLLLAAALAGCCEPIPVDMTVELELVREEVRTLPILASGATSIGAIEVPDSHGRLEWKASFTSQQPSAVHVTGLEIAVEVAGQPLPIQIVRLEGLSGLSKAGDTFSGDIGNGERIVAWWTIDMQRTDADELVLPAGAPYQASIEFAWSLDGCTYSGGGEASHSFQDHIIDSVASTTFRAQSHSITSGNTVGFDVRLGIKNGADTSIEDVTAVAVWLGYVPQVATWSDPTVTVNGLPPTGTAGPGDTIRIQGAPTPTSAATSGDGRWMLLLVVDHDLDRTQGISQDLLGFVDQAA